LTLAVFLVPPWRSREVPRRGGGVMGRNIGAAHDPVADYRDTSLRCAQGGM